MLEWKSRLVILLALAGVLAAASGSLLGNLLCALNFGW
jgi:hypothetical protein